jgi:similar to stage IV sporulation protein
LLLTQFGRSTRCAEKAPELREEKVPADVVATAAGIVLDVDWTAGQPLVEKGDTVTEGDILIAGKMDLPEYTYSEIDMGTYVVHAEGQVTARTWRTLKSMIPLNAQLKELTGREKTLWALNYPGGRLNFYENSGISYERYDKITRTRSLEFSNGTAFPISLTQERVREYSLTAGELNRDAAIDLLKAGLRRELDDILQETDGECIRLDYMATVEGDTLTVTMLAECVEQIGKTVEREGEVGFIPPSSAGN